MGMARRTSSRAVVSDRAVVSNSDIKLRRTALAASISLVLAPISSHAEGWSRNIEVFAMPTSESRNLMGVQWLEPVWQSQDSMLYTDLRGVFDLGDTEEFNFGAGYRQLFFDRRWIFGGYASFDTRESIRNKRHNQVALGIEALSREWDFRANGYIPLTDPRTVGPATFGGRFQGTRLFAGRQTEEALHGADFEIGRLLEFVPFGETRLYLGGYHFDGDVVTKSTGFGKKARLEFRPRKDIALEFGVEDDNLFGTEGFIKIRYSFGYPAETGVRTIDERMVQFVERDIDIKETSRLPEDVTTGIGPGNDLLITDNVVHIDNTADNGGDGSFEDPYNDFAECQSDRCGQTKTLVYVHAGDGTATGYDTPYNMADNQRLIGQGFSLYGIGGDQAPVVTHGGPTATIRLADNNEVAGLDLVNNRVAIFGNNDTGFNIHHNRITGSTNRGIRIVTANGNTSGTIANNTIQGNSGYGILLDNDADGAGSTQMVVLENNTVTNNLDHGVGIRNAGRNGSTATQEVTLIGNTMENNGDSGMYAQNLSVSGGIANQTINASGNSFANNAKYGIDAINENNGSSATQTLDLSGSNLSGNTKYGGYFENLNGTQTVNLTGADVSGNGFGAYKTAGSPDPVITPP